MLPRATPREATTRGGCVKTLVLDIEVLPAVCLVYDLRTTYVNKEMILKPRRTTLICAKWVGDDEMFTFAEWGPGGHQGMLDGIWRLMDDADSIVTFNGDSYDLKELATEFVLAGMNLPSEYASVDLFKCARRRFRFMSSSLQYVAEQLNSGYKKLDSGGIALVKRIIEGDEAARFDYTTYCQGDVLATEELYHRLFTYIPASMLPNVALIKQDYGACPSCGSHELIRNGTRMTRTGRFQRFVCHGCGRNSVQPQRLATSELRGI